MKQELPRWHVERAPKQRFDFEDALSWSALRPIMPLWLADGSAPASQPTLLRVCFDDSALYARFECTDRDIWGTYTERDDPLYDEEVVEVMIAPGAEEPIHYFEFEVSPNGVLFDATIFNPSSTRADLRWDATWNCPNLRWDVRRDDTYGQWWAALAIPWAGISTNGAIPSACRANFYRIERPRDAEPEYSCWSPTLTSPADFHKPARFGILEFVSRS